MSDDPQAISELQGLVTGNRIAIGITALYCYEWFITFDQEVNHIWTRKWSLSTWIFAVNRYATLFDTLLQVFPSPSRASCIAEIYFGDAFELLIFIVSALVTGLRAYALCNRSQWVFLFVFSLSMVPFATNLMIRILEKVVYLPSAHNTVCDVLPPLSPSVELRVSLSTRIALILADIIVLVVTWIRAIGVVREASRIKVRVPLGQVLIRDGTLFFVALLALNIFKLMTDNIPSLFTLNTGGVFFTPLNAIIISRFMLNLRRANQQIKSSSITATGNRSTIRFNSDTILGNLGETLNFGEGDEEYGDINAHEHQARSNPENPDIESSPGETSPSFIP